MILSLPPPILIFKEMPLVISKEIYKKKNCNLIYTKINYVENLNEMISVFIEKWATSWSGFLFCRKFFEQTFWLLSFKVSISHKYSSQASVF